MKENFLSYIRNATQQAQQKQPFDYNDSSRIKFCENRYEISTLKIFNDMLITGHTNGHIKYWNLKSGNILKEFVGHKESITELVIINNELFASSSSDSTIKVWNISINDPIATISGHSEYVSSMFFYNNNIFSSSYDKTIKQWDLEGNLIHTYEGHKDSIFSLCLVDNNRFASVSANSDHCIKLWDIKTKMCLKNIPITNSFVTSRLLFISPNILVSAGGDKVNVWDVNTGGIVGTIDGFQNGILSISRLNEKVIGIGSDCDLLFVDLNSLKLVGSIYCHKNYISGICPISSDTFLTAGHDANIVIHKLHKKRVDLESLVAFVSNSNESDFKLEENRSDLNNKSFL